jgi:hypothetical protein
MNTLSCKLMGGLGNQMFQAAHVFCQGKKHNRPVFLLPYSWTPMQGKGTENYTQNIFKNFQFGTSHDGFKEMVEGPWEYTSVKPFDEQTVFTGYFQSSKNFLGYNNEVRELFSPTSDVIADFFQKYPQLNESNTVSIHIRRGDYLMNPHIHPSVGLSYIQKALDLVQDYSTIFVFSEDKNWVKENLKFSNMIIVEEDEDYKEIWLMSLCKNNIICNSTFSWWGSFLNRNENKKVIAPSIWFGTGGPSNFSDIYESNWIIINVESKNGILEYVA